MINGDDKKPLALHELKPTGSVLHIQTVQNKVAMTLSRNR